MKRRAHYILEETLADRVTIRDVGGPYPVPSVTNDAEAVVEELVETRVLRAGVRLFYYDSNGDLDEIVVEGDPPRFARFAPGPGR